MATCPEFQVSHARFQMTRVTMRRYRGLCTDLLGFALQPRRTPEKLSKETVNKGCATSHRLKWGPLPPNEVGRIAQHVRDHDPIRIPVVLMFMGSGQKSFKLV